MARIRSLFAQGKLPTPISQGSDVVCLPFEIDIPAAGDGTAQNDIVEMGDLPAGHVPVDVVFSAGDLDSGTGTWAASFGVLNADKSDISTAAADGGAAWATGVVVGAAATVSRLSAAAAHTVVPTEANRALGFKITTASNVKAAGKLRAYVFVRAA